MTGTDGDWTSRAGSMLARWAPRIAKVAAWGAFGAVAAGVLGVVGLYGALVLSQPELPADADLVSLNRAPGIIVQDAQGVTLATRGEGFGPRVVLAELPRHVPDAFIAAEDRRFRDHGGIDPHGLARAMWVNLRAMRPDQGGSTITEQLAKVSFVGAEQSLSRKFQQMSAALAIEARFSKDAILEAYLNRVYFGNGAWGIESAARTYFAKTAKELSLAEAAMLASILPAPARYNPRANLEIAQTRAQRTIAIMVETGMIDGAAAVTALAAPATPAVPEETAQAAADAEADTRGYFIDAAIIEARTRGLLEGAGDRILITTYDSALQGEAAKALRRVLDKDGKDKKASQAAIVTMTADGRVRALIGGRSYGASVFNRAVQARRQPGSAFKPFVYAAAMEAGLTPETIRGDYPMSIGTWSPDNADRQHRGDITLTEALARSVNTVAVALSEETGRKRVAAMAARLGITSPVQEGPAMALGASEVSLLEITAAYGAFATEGYRVEPTTLLEVRDGAGLVLYKRRFDPGARVIGAEVARAINLMLGAAIDWGTGKGAKIEDRDAAGKTGTSERYRDAWFVGFTADIITGVWVGNDDDSPMARVTGASLPARIWKATMEPAHKGVPHTALAKAAPRVPMAEYEAMLSGFPIEEQAPMLPEGAARPAPGPMPEDTGAPEGYERRSWPIPPRAPGFAPPGMVQPNMAPPNAMQPGYAMPPGVELAPDAYGRMPGDPYWQGPAGYDTMPGGDDPYAEEQRPGALPEARTLPRTPPPPGTATWEAWQAENGGRR